MSASKVDPIEMIAKSELKDVIVRGFAEVYKVKPTFPVQFLGKWLKNYSKNQSRQKELEATKDDKENKIIEMERCMAEQREKAEELKRQKEHKKLTEEDQFTHKIKETSYLSDLLPEYIPEVMESMLNDRGICLTGSYVGELKHRHKKLQEHNFQAGAELDTQNAKIVEYIGSNKSHKFMIGQILPNQTGRSYEVFKEEEPPAEEEEGKPVKPKKKYLYVPLVQRDQKMHFFKFPKLGSFACFPLKVKSCLFSESFDKGKQDFKSFVKNKQEVDNEFKGRVTEATTVYEDAKRRYEEHEVNEQEANSVIEHGGLKEELQKVEQTLRQIERNPPIIQAFKYDTKQKDYVICLDTIGKDSQICEQSLDFVESKIQFIRQEWEEKEYEMLLSDIKQFIEEESTLETQFNYFKDQQQAIIAANQSQVKQQCVGRQKEAEYQLSLIKAGKLIKILQEDAFVKSMGSYLKYKIPKYQEIVQIILMLLGHKKEKIVLSRSNCLDTRKCLNLEDIEKMMTDLENYELRRESSEVVDNQYKINKLLERLEKIDSEAVGKYNSWLFGLLLTAKTICWTRIQCRDSKIEAHEAKTKAKAERDAQIIKYDEELEKAREAAKAEAQAVEDGPPYNEEDWFKGYVTDNMKPESLEVDELKQFLDIE